MESRYFHTCFPQNTQISERTKKYTVSFFITVIALVSVLVIEPVKIEAASCTSHQYISVLVST